MGDLYTGSSFISQPVQESLDTKARLVGGNSFVGTQDISGGDVNLATGFAYKINGTSIPTTAQLNAKANLSGGNSFVGAQDVSGGNVNVATGYNFTINGVPIGGGGSSWVGTAASDLDMASFDIINIDKLKGANNGVTDITLQSSINANSNQIKNMAMLNPFLTAPSAGQVLTAVNSTAITWATPSGGSGFPSCFIRHQTDDEYGQQAFNNNTTTLFLNAIEGDFGRTDYLLQSDQYDSRITIAAAGTYQVFYSIACYGTGDTIANFSSYSGVNNLSLPISVAPNTGSILSSQNYFTTTSANQEFRLQTRVQFPETEPAFYGRRTVSLGNGLGYRFVEIILKRIS